MDSSVVWSVFTVLCKPLSFQFLTIFHHPTDTHCVRFPFPPSIGNSALLSISTDSPFLDVSYKWSPTIYDLRCLVSFTEPGDSEVHLGCSICQYFIPFSCQVFHCTHTRICSSMDVWVFPPVTIMNNGDT